MPGKRLSSNTSLHLPSSFTKFGHCKKHLVRRTCTKKNKCKYFSGCFPTTRRKYLEIIRKTPGLKSIKSYILKLYAKKNFIGDQVLYKQPKSGKNVKILAADGVTYKVSKNAKVLGEGV